MTEVTTDLMYAAYLLSLGGTVDCVEDCGRYSKVHVRVPDYALAANKDRAARLLRLSERADMINELPVIYEQSMIKDISMHYYQLKQRIVRGKA